MIAPLNTKWTPERTERLKVLAADGKTAAVMAEELGTTRNSVIAKIHREHLSWTGAADRAKFARTKGAPMPTPERNHYWRPRTLTPGAGQEISRVRDGSNLDNKPPTPTSSSPCTLVDLKADSCKWPLWDAFATAKDFLYCNEWSAEGQSYCAHHYLIAYQPRQASRRLERMAAFVD